MRVVLGVCGASGSVYARRLLGLLSEAASTSAIEAHWLASSAAEQVWHTELGEPMPESIAGIRRWDRLDFSAPFASGSSAADATILAPCSMSRLAEVAHGTGKDLMSRACDVALKERRRLILMVRETPLSLVHLRNMTTATEAGAIVLPASPSFYSGARDIESAIDTVIMRALDLAGIKSDLARRWGAAP